MMPWTLAHQVFLSVGFSRQEYWTGLPFPPPGDLPDLGIEPEAPALAFRFSTTEPPPFTLSQIRIVGKKRPTTAHVYEKIINLPAYTEIDSPTFCHIFT